MTTGNNSAATVSRLWTWLQDIIPNDKGLVWCHTTDAFAFRAILESKTCSLTLCEVFKEELLYFFYGRPAFRIKPEYLRKSSACPVVLLFDEHVIDIGRRLFPFDTGAFQSNRYENWMHPKMKLSDFELKCILEAPRKHVAAFFGTNENYLKTRTQQEMKAHIGEFEVEALIRLLQEHGTRTRREGRKVANSDSNIDEERIDDRRMAIELQVGSAISIDEHLLRAVIYPDELDQALWLEEFMRNNPCVIFRDYMMHWDKLASEYQTLLEDRSLEIQRELRLVL